LFIINRKKSYYVHSDLPVNSFTNSLWLSFHSFRRHSILFVTIFRTTLDTAWNILFRTHGRSSERVSAKRRAPAGDAISPKYRICDTGDKWTLIIGNNLLLVVDLRFSDVTKYSYFLISACKGKFYLKCLTFFPEINF